MGITIVNKPTKSELVIFDFDGTIIPNNSFYLFIKYLYIDNFTIYKILNLLFYSLMRKLRFISSLEFKNQLLKVLKGKKKEEVEVLLLEFAKSLIPLFRNDALKKINYHRNNGAIIIIISGALFDYLEPLKTILNISQIFGTRLKYINGICTGLIDGQEIIGKEKLKVLNDFINNNLNICKIYLYTDSLLDLPLLERVDIGILINIRCKLKKYKHYFYEYWK